jgi:hypothetical protein
VLRPEGLLCDGERPLKERLGSRAFALLVSEGRRVGGSFKQPEGTLWLPNVVVVEWVKRGRGMRNSPQRARICRTGGYLDHTNKSPGP